MPSVAQFIQSLATKAGIATDNKDLVGILSNADLTKITVPEELNSSIEAALHTIDSAKSKLKPTLFAEALNGVDSELERVMDELQLDDATKAILKGEKSTPKRAAQLAKKIQELETQKAAATTKGEKGDLQNEINALKKDKAQLLDSHKAEIENLNKVNGQKIIDMLVANSLYGYEYALGDVPMDLKVETAKSALMRALRESDAHLVEDNGQIKIVAKDGSDFYDKSNHKQDYKTYKESVLAQNKLLKGNDGSAAGNGSDNNKKRDLNADGKASTPSPFLTELEGKIQAALADG